MDNLEIFGIPYFKKGSGIHIKKENRGLFTDYCGGKVTNECIQRGKNSSDPKIRKRATFAQNSRAWKHQQGGSLYSAGNIVNQLYNGIIKETYLGKPSHNYDFTISNKKADSLGYFPDKRGHRDDRVKKTSHPTHPSRGKWNGMYQYHLTDKGIQDVNHTLFGMNDGGQDPQATMYYKKGIVLPEITITPKGNYLHNTYDNIKMEL